MSEYTVLIYGRAGSRRRVVSFASDLGALELSSARDDTRHVPPRFILIELTLKDCAPFVFGALYTHTHIGAV